MNLYIDIDGVLLGKCHRTGQLQLANHTHEFLTFALAHFDCFWLTTHCKGDHETAIEYLKPYASSNVLALLKQIKATNFKTFKTEALQGDFVWVDDQPTAYEFQVLEKNNWLNRWVQVNTRKDIDGLKDIINYLQQQYKYT